MSRCPLFPAVPCHRVVRTDGSAYVPPHLSKDQDIQLEAGDVTLNADKARTVFAIKRSKNPGFAGIDNELYFSDRTWMLFGDAKNVVGELVKQLSGGSGLH